MPQRAENARRVHESTRYFEIMLSHQIESHIAIAGIRKWGESELQKRYKRADGTFIYYRCPIKCFTRNTRTALLLHFYFHSRILLFHVQIFSSILRGEFISSRKMDYLGKSGLLLWPDLSFEQLYNTHIKSINLVLY